MLKAYFDKSGQHDTKFMTLSGIAASDATWQEIEETWDYLLKVGEPKATYMHVVEALNLRDAFKRDNGWDKEKVWNLINALMSYLTDLPKENLCHFTCIVDLQAYEKLRLETYQMDSPVKLCIDSCVKRVMFWYLREYQALDLEASYFFDQNEPFEPAFRAEWESEKAKDEEVGTTSIWAHIVQVSNSDMRKTPGLQVADMLAWGHNREATDGASTFPHIALTLRALMPSKSIKWEESNLRRRYKPLIYRP